jgi:hypothetical protein
MMAETVGTEPERMMAKIVIVEGGRVRAPIDIARDFVREQSVGEWDEETINRDAKALARLLNHYGAVYAGLGHEPSIVIEYDA